MVRFRITICRGEAPEQTWVLLPGEEAARTQARELAQRVKPARVRVYREETGQAPALLLELPPPD